MTTSTGPTTSPARRAERDTREPDTHEPAHPEPDTQDWTWVLARPCGECGLEAAAVTLGEVGERIRVNAAAWQAALAGEQVRRRPRERVWSVLEYGAHVRDVHRVFDARLQLVLQAPEGTEHTFANWDQDAAALAGRYHLADPAEVAEELMAAAARVAARYDAVPPDAAHRIGHRSNGSTFTTTTLGRYHLHDVVHHLWDVGDGHP